MTSGSRPIPLGSTAALLIVAGCAASSDYPSLSPRPIERVSLSEPAPAPAAFATPAAAAAARYRPIVERAHAGHDAFQARFKASREILAAGRRAPVGSDAWGRAQQALSRLQSDREPVARALGELQAASEDAAVQTDAGLATAVAQALADVAAIDAADARLVATLGAGGG